MFVWLINNLLWTEGLSIVALIVLAITIGLLWWRPLFYIGFAFLLFCLYFFRNPVRDCPQAKSDPHVLVCPADGKVVDISFSDSNEFNGYVQRVSIFLSIFDVHVNWAPMGGAVSDVTYRPGEFSLAYLSKSSEKNERNTIQIVRNDGTSIEVRQIAGAIARRISCWVCEGDTIKAGEKYGMIKFGSRVDVLLPGNFSVEVEKGQQVYGGETVLGRLKNVDNK